MLCDFCFNKHKNFHQMKKNIFFSLIGVLLFYFIGLTNLNAQKLLREVSLESQIEKSDMVVEGEVIGKRSFWDAERRLIYTANTIQVYKVFKGEPIATIEVITVGGTVGFRVLISSASLKLQKGSAGVFMLSKSDVNLDPMQKSSVKKFRSYGASQGFYKYNLYNDLAVNPFHKKKGVKSSFYNEIISHTKKNFIIMSNFDVQSKSAKSIQSKGVIPSSITFTPTTVSAGTKTVLTINGVDFGGTQGKVWFSSADDGGSTLISALDTQVLTWGDTQITVEVPSGAGTGIIMVEDSSVASAASASNLTVSYAEINVLYDAGSGIEEFQVQHIGDNGSGGYTWEMYTDFFNDTEHPGAKEAFERAFNNWVCETGINWEVSNAATTTDVIGVADLEDPFDGELDADGENVIRFDNGSELDVDILGTCYSWYGSCNGTDWVITDLDIVFDDATNWYFGTGTPGVTEYDFESVALHELGHGHQLGHVIDTNNDVMHYALSNSEDQRVLSANNITAAGNVQTRSTGSIVCGQLLMTNASCPLSVEENKLDNTIRLYPNPSKGMFYIKKASFINLEYLTIYDMSGRLVLEHSISGDSNIKTINLRSVSNGVYFANIYSDIGVVTKRIVLK